MQSNMSLLKQSAFCCRLLLQVVDTPGLYDSAVPDQTTVTEILKCLALSSPGPHVFLWVLKANERFNNRDADVLKIMEGLFGGNVKSYVILVFTHVDLFDGDFNQELSDPPGDLKAILQAVEGRWVAFSNRSADPASRLAQLMSRVTELVNSRRAHFSSDLTRNIEPCVEQRLREIEQTHKIDHEAAKAKFRKGLVKGEEKTFMKVLFAAVGGFVGGCIGTAGGPVSTAVGAGLGATAGATVLYRCSIM